MSKIIRKERPSFLTSLYSLYKTIFFKLSFPLLIVSIISVICHPFIARTILNYTETEVNNQDPFFFKKMHEFQTLSDKILLYSGLSLSISASSLIFLYLQGFFKKEIDINSLTNAYKEKIENSDIQIIEDVIRHNEINGCNRTVIRLKELISITTRNSNINLAVGVLTTIAAIAVLTFTLADDKYQAAGKVSDLYHYLPRLTMVIFIEVFSFFFLKLYKKNLEDVKYLNNEITNFECKVIALKASLLNNQTESLKDVIQNFATTERNFVLKKGENTVETKKLLIESETEARFFEKITSLLKK